MDPAPISQRQIQVQSMPRLGLGLGLRHVHFDHILSCWPQQVGWFEVISENFMFSHGRQRHILRQVAERYPIAMHGVSLSIGSTAALDQDYLRALKTLAAEIQPAWISDHLCWTGVLGANTHDLLPLPLTEESLAHCISRVTQVQDFLGRPLVLENPSTYLGFTGSTLSEPQFLTELVQATGCGLLLDVNNCYVTCFNHGLDPLKYLQDFPMQSVVQMHLAGHTHCGTHIIDTHDRAVVDAVWELFRIAWQSTGQASTLLEWDGNIPAFDDCVAELHKARLYMHGAPDLQILATPGKVEHEELSTPIRFLVPEVMPATLTA